MYLFYDIDGKIIATCSAKSSDEKLTYIPEGLIALYIDDIEYTNVKNNCPDYLIIDGEPVYTPIPESLKLLPLQEGKIEEINLKCNLEIIGGFDSSVLGESHHYKFDMEYQANMNQQMGLISLDPTIEFIPWPTSSGVLIHTKSQFIQLLKEASDFKSNKLFRYFDLKAQILAMTTIEQVKEVVW